MTTNWDILDNALALLKQELLSFSNNLKGSDSWPTIQPELVTAFSKIRERRLISVLEVCRSLQSIAPEKDIFNISGLLATRQAIELLTAIRDQEHAEPLELKALVTNLFMAGAASQQHHGMIPVGKKLQEIEPIVERDSARQAGCHVGGKKSGIERQNELEERNIKIAELAKNELDNGRGRGGTVDRLAKRFSLSTRQIRTILNNHGL